MCMLNIVIWSSYVIHVVMQSEWVRVALFAPLNDFQLDFTSLKKINISSDFFVLVMISMIHVGKAYQQYSKSTVTGPRGKNHQSVTPLSSSLLYVIDYQWFWFPIFNASHSIDSQAIKKYTFLTCVSCLLTLEKIRIKE